MTQTCKQIIVISHNKFKDSNELEVPYKLTPGSNQYLWVGQKRPLFSHVVALLIRVLKWELHALTPHRVGNELQKLEFALKDGVCTLPSKEK